MRGALLSDGSGALICSIMKKLNIPFRQDVYGDLTVAMRKWQKEKRRECRFRDNQESSNSALLL